MIPYQRKRSHTRRGNGYVLLDSTWAKRLGVRRTGGLYRIGRRDLADRLAALQDHSHVVGFHEIEAFLVDSVRDFLAPGLHAGAAAIVVATASHREMFDRELRAAGIDLPAAPRCGRYIALDASDAMSRFMVESMPDGARFEAAMGTLVAQAAQGAREVRIYGEMVTMLWDRGNVPAVIALEDLWNDLATKHPFSLFCAYPISAFATDASTEQFRKICEQHSRVIPVPGAPAPALTEQGE